MKVSGQLSDSNGDVEFENLYPALVQCFFVILCGYTAGRLKLVSQLESKGLNVFVSSFSLPSLIFLSLAQLDLSSVNWMFLVSILVSKTVVFLGVIIITFCINRPIHYGKPGIYAIFCTQSNDFAIGYPILMALYNKTHTDYPAYLYLMAPISLAILNPIAFVLMELGKSQDQVPLIAKLDTIAESNLETNPSLITSESTPPSRTVESNVGRRRTMSETIRRASEVVEDLPSVDREDKPIGKCERRKSQIKFVATIFRGIVTNPIVFMTAFGIIGNSFFQHLGFLTGILQVFGSAFSATALFVLGLRMVGTVEKLKGGALVVPGILIAIKLLVLPLINREVISLLQPGANASETLDLSTFGFLYGTFPAAPAVFVFSTQYNLEVDLISSSMVACTFISAPLMFISAKMTSLDQSQPEHHQEELTSFGYDLSILGLLLGLWLTFLFCVNKAYSKLPHRITCCLIASQMLICIGMLLEPLTKNSASWSLYLQFAVLAFGVYSARIWSCFLAVTLVLLQSRSLCFVIKLMPFFVIAGWGIPLILVVAICVVNTPMDRKMSPNFPYGSFQAAVTLFLLTVCFLVTSGCLILQQRYRKRYARYLMLVQEVNSRDLHEVDQSAFSEGPSVSSGPVAMSNTSPNNGGSNNGGSKISGTSTKHVVDIEDIVSENASHSHSNSTSEGCNVQGEICSSRFKCTDIQREACELTVKQYNENIDDKIEEVESSDLVEQQQILRHVVLLLIIVTSMFIGIMLSIWTLVVDDLFSGIYVELAFLDVTLNLGQICLTFAVFGLDVKPIISPVVDWWRKYYYGADTVVLQSADELSFETTHVCDQFIAHHLNQCAKDISKDCRIRLTVYKECFKGKDLVAWLEKQRLAKDSAEAVQYASHLLEGRVIRHVEKRHHFSDSNLLFTFRA